LKRKKAKRKTNTRTKTFRPQPETVKGMTPIFSAVCLLVLLGAAVYGLERVKAHVYTQPEFQPEVKVELGDPPGWVNAEGWNERVLQSVVLPEDAQPLDYSLLANVADQMAEGGWVSKVEQVTRETDGTIRIDCEYRRPIAMLLVNDRFVPVDEEGFRLPESYKEENVTESSGWLRVFGVRARMPDVNGQFVEDDAHAAIELAKLISEQDFAPRITSINVENFRGRVDRRKSHIFLTPRGGRKDQIAWGSAIGEEIEEEPAIEKLRNIAVWLKRGSPQARVDVAVYRNAYIEFDVQPEEPVIRTADGAAERR
jgi:hypothetical protein